MITDVQGKITEINNTASKLLGLGNNDLINTQFSRFSTSEYQNSFSLTANKLPGAKKYIQVKWI